MVNCIMHSWIIQGACLQLRVSAGWDRNPAPTTPRRLAAAVGRVSMTEINCYLLCRSSTRHYDACLVDFRPDASRMRHMQQCAYLLGKVLNAT